MKIEAVALDVTDRFMSAQIRIRRAAPAWTIEDGSIASEEVERRDQRGADTRDKQSIERPPSSTDRIASAKAKNRKGDAGVWMSVDARAARR